MPDGTDRLSDALDHSWKWFSYHAQQRLTAFNFYLVIVGVLIVGYFKCLEEGWSGIGALMAAFGVVISLAFWLLDIRNTELVNCGRDALRRLEPEFGLQIREKDESRALLSDSMGRPSALIFWLLEHVTRGSRAKFLTRHQTWLRFILFLGVVSFTAASALSLAGFGFEAGPARGRAAEHVLRRVDRMIIVLNQLDSANKERPVTQGSARVIRDSALVLILLSQEAASDCRLGASQDPACMDLRVWSTAAMPVFQQLSIYDGVAAPRGTSPTLPDLTARLDRIVDSLRSALFRG